MINKVQTCLLQCATSTLISALVSCLFVNEIVVSAQVNLDLVDPDSCFTLTPGEGAVVAHAQETGRRAQAHTASVTVQSGHQAEFSVTFKPSVAQRSQVTSPLLLFCFYSAPYKQW